MIGRYIYNFWRVCVWGGGGWLSKSSGHGNNFCFCIEKKKCDIRDSLERIGVISLRTARKTEGDDKYKNKSETLRKFSTQSWGGEANIIKNLRLSKI